MLLLIIHFNISSVVRSFWSYLGIGLGWTANLMHASAKYLFQPLKSNELVNHCPCLYNGLHHSYMQEW